jgi:hypothetical protein
MSDKRIPSIGPAAPPMMWGGVPVGPALPVAQITEAGLPVGPVSTTVMGAKAVARKLSPKAQQAFKDEMFKRYMNKFNPPAPKPVLSEFEKLRQAGAFRGDRTTGSIAPGPYSLDKIGADFMRMLHGVK